MSGFEHYKKVRAELVELYTFMTERQFPVVAPRSVFLTTEQLNELERRPPPGGIARFTKQIQIDVTPIRIINAYEIGGDEFEMGFGRPKRDIPLLYESMQEYIRLWVDVKINSYGYGTASIEELRAIERVTRSLFNIYRYYRQTEEQERMDKITQSDDGEHGLTSLVLGTLKYGMEGFSDVSYVSYVDQYYEKLRASSEKITMYVNPNGFTEPQRQDGIVKQFQLPKMQHNLSGWE